LISDISENICPAIFDASRYNNCITPQTKVVKKPGSAKIKECLHIKISAQEGLFWTIKISVASVICIFMI
jgi:hypothetical protein